MKLFQILKEIVQPSEDYYNLVDKIKQQGGKFLGSGDYGAAYLIGDRVVKVTTDSQELEDAQKIKGRTTKYFAYIYEVEIVNELLGIITMQNLQPYTADPDRVPIDDIYDEADELGISPDLEGPGGSIRMDNVMQDANGNVKIIDV